MESIAKKIVKYRILILIVATILLIPSGIGFIKTKVKIKIIIKTAYQFTSVSDTPFLSWR